MFKSSYASEVANNYQNHEKGIDNKRRSYNMPTNANIDNKDVETSEVRVNRRSYNMPSTSKNDSLLNEQKNEKFSPFSASNNNEDLDIESEASDRSPLIETNGLENSPMNHSDSSSSLKEFVKESFKDFHWNPDEFEKDTYLQESEDIKPRLPLQNFKVKFSFTNIALNIFFQHMSNLNTIYRLRQIMVLRKQTKNLFASH